MVNIKTLVCLLSILLIFLPGNIFAETPILNKPTSTEEQCEQWMLDHDVEQEFIDLIPYIYERCTEVGVDPTLVVSQSALETGYFTSYTLRTKHNTAGIKNRSNTNEFAYYETYEDGFNAQICHLALYAGSSQDGYYYSERLDGWVTNIEGLGGTWAEDPHYSQKVINIMKNIQNYKIVEDKKTVKKVSVESDDNTKEENKKSTGKDIISNILSRDKKRSKSVDFIFSFLR